MIKDSVVDRAERLKGNPSNWPEEVRTRLYLVKPKSLMLLLDYNKNLNPFFIGDYTHPVGLESHPPPCFYKWVMQHKILKQLIVIKKNIKIK